MANIANLLSQVFLPAKVQTAAPVTKKSTNPFNNNPFVSYNGYAYDSSSYAKNNPVRGGYFAGYYNGKQNIVGQRLFVEV